MTVRNFYIGAFRRNVVSCTPEEATCSLGTDHIILFSVSAEVKVILWRDGDSWVS